MSDLVERALLKIADDGYAIGCCPITDREARELARDIALEIAAMQTDAAPALKPAVEVADMIVAAANVTTCDGYYEVDIDTAAAVIEADRAAIIAAKDAELAALQAHADAMAGAVTLAANRLARCALEPEYGTEQSYEWREWSDEARQALRAYEEHKK